MRIFDPRNEYGDELLTKRDANINFPTKTEVADTYASKLALGAYVTVGKADSTYLSQEDASSTYLSQASASSTYLSQASASSTYATKTSLNTKADKTALDTKADKSQLEAKADKSQLEAKADKSEMELKADKTELDAKLSTDQVVSTTVKLNKTLVNNTLTITASDVPDITNWAIYQVEAVLSSGQKFQIMSDYTKGSDGSITMVIGDGRSLDFSNVIVNLIRESSSGVQAGESLEVLVSLIDETIASGDKEAIQTLGAKLAATGAEEYTLAGAKTGDEVVVLMTGSNMGAFISPIATLSGGNLVLNDTNFSYNMMSLEVGHGEEGGCKGIFRYSNIASFNSSAPSLTDGNGMFYGCNKLTTLTSELSNLTNGTNMFACSGLTSWNIDMPNLKCAHCMYVEGPLKTFSGDLSYLEEADFMFLGCNNLTSFTSNLSSLTDGDSMFHSCYSLTSFTSELPSLENGNCMFFYCSKLTSFTSELSSLTNGYCMFYNTCLTSWNIDIPNLTNGTEMFSGCSNLTSFTSNLHYLTNGYKMFYGCRNLTSFTSNLSSLTNGQYMFTRCDSLAYCEPKNCKNSTALKQIIDSLPSYDKADGTHMILFSTGNEELNDELTINALMKGWGVGTEVLGGAYYYYGSKNMEEMMYTLVDGHNMFSHDKSLTEWNYDIPNLENGNYMFNGCSNLTSFTSELPNLTNGSYMFAGCSKITSFTSNLPNLYDGSGMFSNCNGLTSFTSDPPKLTNGNYMFAGCSKITSFTSNLPKLYDGSSMFYGCSNLASFTSNLPKLTNGNSMFWGCKLDTPSIQRIANSLPTYTNGTHNMHITSGATTLKQKELDAHKLILSKGWNSVMTFRNIVGEVKDVDFSGITNAPSMFRDCTGLTSWNVTLPQSLSNATYMFYGCSGLTSWTVPLPQSLSDAPSMFRDCTGLISWIVELPESLTDATSMFNGCAGLTSWTVALPQSLTSSSYMFSGCSGLTSWNVALPEYLINAESMFYRCTGLTSWTVPLPQSLTNAYQMFSSCYNLTSFTPWGKNEDGTLKNTGATGNLTSGYYMFHLCKLDLASVKRIADWLPQRTSAKPTGSESSNGWIHIGVAQGVNSGTEFNAAISKITSKNWGVVICVNSSHTTV